MRKKFLPAIKVDNAHLMRLDDPGKERPFGVPLPLLQGLSARHSVDTFLSAHSGEPTKFGEEGMAGVITALKQCNDRTWHMVEVIAAQTGISFPHKFQYLLETFLLAAIPKAGYSILQSTTGALAVHIENCPCLGREEFPCQGICRAALDRAGKECGLTPAVSVEKSSACEFRISLDRRDHP